MEDNLTKLGWRVLNENDPLWVKVLKSKYKIPPNPRNWKNHGKDWWCGKKSFKSKLGDYRGEWDLPWFRKIVFMILLAPLSPSLTEQIRKIPYL